MKPTTTILIIVSIVVSFAAGYLIGSHHQKQKAVNKDAIEFHKAEKSFDDLLQLPEDMRPKKDP